MRHSISFLFPQILFVYYILLRMNKNYFCMQRLNLAVVLFKSFKKIHLTSKLNCVNVRCFDVKCFSEQTLIVPREMIVMQHVVVFCVQVGDRPHTAGDLHPPARATPASPATQARCEEQAVVRGLGLNIQLLGWPDLDS